MSSIFTYQDELPRIQSPWSTPGDTTPQIQNQAGSLDSTLSRADGRAKLEPEKQDGPCEYKLHLLLRARRHFVSMTTSQNAAHIRGAALNLFPTGRSMSETLLQRPTYQPSPQTRQARLQQLTTQLLWRLQQSSPFHSASNAELVLPILPEATPRLGVPDRPAKLLPGLEESQGALYEIGVADDGTLVGLVSDELEESLNNLGAMAASLGCVVDVLRRVVVGSCTWVDHLEGEEAVPQQYGDLLVAEVLVRPDSGTAAGNLLRDGSDLEIEDTSSRASTEQLRVALTGPSAAGKSSLLGTLTTSVLDNGRGKSRLSLLKHRHEIASGVTSSVAHELLAYKQSAGREDFVINYATGDVSTWTDLHNSADRLCFMSDSPGLLKYAKSTFRALISWKPDWTCYCVAADDETTFADSGALAHLQLCLQLNLRMIIVITKMDLATKLGLRNVLSNVLTCLKNAGRRPLILSTAAAPVPAFALDSIDACPDLQRVTLPEITEVDNAITAIQGESSQIVPITMTSTVSGSGIGKLHVLLARLPAPQVGSGDHGQQEALFHIDEVFGIPPVRIYNVDAAAKADSLAGIVLCGHVSKGSVKIGDVLRLGPFLADDAGKTLPRSKSFTTQDSHRLSLSTSVHAAKDGPASNGTSHSKDHGCYIDVKIVSLRNLRLPVLQLGTGETGTVGIEPCGNRLLPLQRARKGMVLIAETANPQGHRSFTATFPSKIFLNASPPLLLGGHAIVYINSVRAAVKVVALALVDDASAGASPTEVFAFEEEDVQDDSTEREVRITMRFVSTVEYLEVGNQALVIPTLSAAGPVTGPVAATSGLTGFVGRVIAAT